MAQRTRPVASSRHPGAPTAGAGKPGPRRRRRTRFDAPPPRASTLSGWALLPLRAFLGFTFSFAGLQKLANPNFFNANSPSSIQAQLIASIRISPVHLLLGHLLRFAVPIGIVIALAELAVGLGAPRTLDPGGRGRRHLPVAHPLPDSQLPLLAVLHRCRHRLPVRLDPAPPGGIGWRAVPRRGDRRQGGGREQERAADRGADPLRAGATGLRQLRGRYLRRTGRTALRRPPLPVPGRRARQPGGAGPRRGGPPDPGPRRHRRRRVRRHRRRCRGRRRRARSGRRRCAEPGGGRHVRPLPQRAGAGAGTTTTTAPAGAPRRPRPGHDHAAGRAAGKRIGLASQVPVGGAATFTDPATGDPGLVLQLTKDQFVAYDAICPHAGCTVGYAARRQIDCVPVPRLGVRPHDGRRGQPTGARGLTPIHVAVSADGSLLADG